MPVGGRLVGDRILLARGKWNESMMGAFVLDFPF